MHHRRDGKNLRENTLGRLVQKKGETANRAKWIEVGAMTLQWNVYSTITAQQHRITNEKKIAENLSPCFSFFFFSSLHSVVEYPNPTIPSCNSLFYLQKLQKEKESKQAKYMTVRQKDNEDKIAHRFDISAMAETITVNDLSRLLTAVTARILSFDVTDFLVTQGIYIYYINFATDIYKIDFFYRNLTNAPKNYN